MNHLFSLLVINVMLTLTLASEADLTQASRCGCGVKPYCPPCNPKAGCRIWGCPCTHDGFIMHPGNEPLNPPRPVGCPKCISVCDNLAIKCMYPYLQCSAEQVATYKCIEPIPVVIPDEAIIGAPIGKVQA